MELRERFWSRVKVGEPEECWPWQGYTLKDGYGGFDCNGKRIVASRLAWILTYGQIPKGMYVLHRCDNPACVNPKHLFLGTQKDNMQDAVSKWRKCGPHNGRTKLSWPQVDVIRLLAKEGWSTYRLAGYFHVDYKTVWQILKGKTWREPAQVMLEGEAEDASWREDYPMKVRGMWLVNERIETPTLSLEFPVGIFSSREAALAFVKGKEDSYHLRWIACDLTGAEKESAEAEESFGKESEGAETEENIETESAETGESAEAEENSIKENE